VDETRRRVRMIEFRFRIFKDPRKNMTSVKSPTLKEKLIRQNSSGENLLKERSGSEMIDPRMK